MILTTRNASLDDVVAILEDQRSRAIDAVVSGGYLRFRDGNLVVSGLDNVLTPEGFMDPNGSYRPTSVADKGLTDKSDLPIGYLRTLREKGRTDLIDANLNGLFRGKSIRRGDVTETIHAADERSFLIRLLRGDNGDGVLRAFLSKKYKVMDNLDALLAVLAGIRAAGVQVTPEIDLTERRMIVRVVAEEVKAYAADLLAGYRSPFTGETGADNPTVFAGFVFSNSEVGGGAWDLRPRFTVQVCRNGLTRSVDAVRSVHLGGAQEDGVVNYSEETVAKTLEVVTLKTRDAVKTFLDVDYMTEALAEMTAKAGTVVEGAKAPEVIKTVGQRLGFDKTQQDGILSYFLNGGQQTSGGLLQAITAYVQDDSVDPDTRLDIENRAVEVLDLV